MRTAQAHMAVASLVPPALAHCVDSFSCCEVGVAASPVLQFAHQSSCLLRGGRAALTHISAWRPQGAGRALLLLSSACGAPRSDGLRGNLVHCRKSTKEDGGKAAGKGQITQSTFTPGCWGTRGLSPTSSWEGGLGGCCLSVRLLRLSQLCV